MGSKKTPVSNPTRKFGKYVLDFRSIHKKKSVARRRAQILRGSGHLARVIEINSSYYGRWWKVYSTPATSARVRASKWRPPKPPPLYRPTVRPTKKPKRRRKRRKKRNK